MTLQVAEGFLEGLSDGKKVSSAFVGGIEGIKDGCEVGFSDGRALGCSEGLLEGDKVGCSLVGKEEGEIS